MPYLKPEKPKTEALRRQRALNLHPERVTDPLFQQNEFYDPHDLVQVKYEMLQPGSGRQGADQSIRSGFWILPADLLSDAARF